LAIVGELIDVINKTIEQLQYIKLRNWKCFQISTPQINW